MPDGSRCIVGWPVNNRESRPIVEGGDRAIVTLAPAARGIDAIFEEEGLWERQPRFLGEIPHSESSGLHAMSSVKEHCEH